MKNRLILPLAGLLLMVQAGVKAAEPRSAADIAANETKQIEVLKSGAGLKEKHDALQSLAYLGTKDSVLTVATLLVDEKLSHMARYALEQIKDPSSSAALIDALGKAKGMPLVGVIGSVGNMRDAKAIDPLAKLLGDANPEVVDAAAHALGRIGGMAAIKPLMAAMAKPSLGIYDGVLRCAETLPHKDAIALYDALRKPPAPQWVRMAGLRGAILARQDQALPLLTESIRGEDYAMTLAAARAARELPGSAVTKALVADFDKLDADRQLLVVQILGDRKDKAGNAQLLATAKNSEGKLKTAAVKAIVQVGDAASIPLLASLAVGDDEVAKTARTGLSVAGKDADAPIADMLKSPSNKVRLIATDLAVQRRMTQTVPQLLMGATDADGAVATASLAALSSLGGMKEVPAIIKVLTSGASMQPAENALTTIYSRNKEAASADALIAALPAAPAPSKLAILRLLRRVGGPKALAEVRTAMNDQNADVKENAARNLCDWQSVDALPALMDLAKAPPTPALKILALRGIFRLIPLQTVTPDQKLASVKAALALVERPDEKKLALAALGEIPTADSLALVTPELANPALKEEASLAAVTIGEQLAKTQPAIVSDAMKLVVPATQDKALAKRAQALVK